MAQGKAEKILDWVKRKGLRITILKIYLPTFSRKNKEKSNDKNTVRKNDGKVR